MNKKYWYMFIGLVYLAVQAANIIVAVESSLNGYYSKATFFLCSFMVLMKIREE